MKQIPNLFTLLNLFSGCVAIVFITQYHPATVSGLSGIALMTGSIFIFVAAVIDFFDGFVARLFHAVSPMGAQLDSLADVVSFGVAPGMVLFKMLEAAFLTQPQISNPFWYQLPAFILPCAGAWRLAKFNLDKEQRYYFKGVPIPAAGLMVASLPLAMVYSSPIGQIIQHPFFIYAIILLVSWLMVSNIPMMSLKFNSRRLGDNLDKIIVVAVGLLLVIFLQWAAVPFIFIAYVIVSLIFPPTDARLKV